MIAGAGFAMMAWKLARERKGRFYADNHPNNRQTAYYVDGPTREYYRIIDEASWQGQHVRYLGVTVFL